MRYKKEITVKNNIKNIVIGYIREYDNYKQWADEKYKQISLLMLIPENGKNTFPNTAEVLKNTLRFKVVEAIDSAYRMLLSAENIDEKTKARMKKQIWKSCIDGRYYNFFRNNYNLPVSKSTFYRLRAEFIYTIKELLEL